MLVTYLLHSYSIVIEGERGNRQRIYSQEQLLQEAVSLRKLDTVINQTDCGHGQGERSWTPKSNTYRTYLRDRGQKV